MFFSSMSVSKGEWQVCVCVCFFLFIPRVGCRSKFEVFDVSVFEKKKVAIEGKNICTSQIDMYILILVPRSCPFRSIHNVCFSRRCRFQKVSGVAGVCVSSAYIPRVVLRLE